MEKKIFKTIVVEKDSFGNVVKVLECRTCDTGTIKELKQQELDYLTRNEKDKQEKLAKLDKELVVRKEKEKATSFIVAKLQFNDLVECGVCQTNDDFEKMYIQFLLSNGTFNLDIAPFEYKKILEKLL